MNVQVFFYHLSVKQLDVRDNFKQLCKPLNFEDAINKGQLYRIAFSKENIDKLKLILTKLNCKRIKFKTNMEM